MLSISPPDKMEQLITVFSQRLQPMALQRLSVAEILQDASALALMQEDIPPMDNFQVMKQQKATFGRMMKFLQLHEPTGYEKDEEHKRTAVRYLALRTMLQQCNDIKISSIQETCLDKVLRWFEKTETNAINSATASAPILPPRMSPKKPCFPLTPALDKCSSETSFRPATTGSSETVASKLEKYKMPDLRASHIRRIAELRSRGADISEKNLPTEEDNNDIGYKPRGLDDLRKKEDEKRMVKSTFKRYHPETDAEHEMNLFWIRRRKEEEIKRKKDEEVKQRVQKWSMDRSRDESENLRKRESTKLVAGLGQMLQEGVDQEKPFEWRKSQILHPDLTRMTAQSNQSAAVASIKPGITATKAAKEVSPQDNVASRKLPLQAQTRGKQPAQIVIKSRKPSVNAGGGGMHFRNQLPPNYVPPGLSSVPKPKHEVPSATQNTRLSTSQELRSSFNRLEKRASTISEDLSSESEEEEEDPVMDDSVKKKTKSESQQAMKLQSYHVPYYYEDTDYNAAWKISTLQKPHPRGTIPVQPLPADPELRCLQEASALRRVFAIPIEKKLNTATQPASDREAKMSSSRKSARSESKSRGSKSAKGKRVTGSCSSYIPAEPQFTASTSDLRQTQMEELEKIRRLFQENNLSFSSEVLERGLLVPEDRPLLQSINDLPFAGSRLLCNPLTRRSKPTKPKKKPSSKKKTKKTKKGSKTPKSSRK